MNPASCVFCEIIAGRAAAAVVHESRDSLVIVPLCPVVEGHVLVIPRSHVLDAADDPVTAGMAMHDAANYARDRLDEFNIITSAGVAATQSVFHLHLHVVPRAVNDGLMVPWGTLHGEDPKAPHRCRRVVALEQQLAAVMAR